MPLGNYHVHNNNNNNNQSLTRVMHRKAIDNFPNMKKKKKKSRSWYKLYTKPIKSITYKVIKSITYNEIS